MILWQACVSFALLMFLVLSPLVRGRLLRVLLFACCLLAAFIPVNGLELAAYLRSFTDDLAMTTLIALSWLALLRLGITRPPEPNETTGAVIMIASMAVILYPATLGLTYLDPYRWGFNPRTMIVIAGALALVLLWTRQRLAALMLAGATLGFALRIKPSENYWDYLVDPVIALFCCASLAVSIVRYVIRRKQNTVARLQGGRK